VLKIPSGKLPPESEARRTRSSDVAKKPTTVHGKIAGNEAMGRRNDSKSNCQAKY
jgi:hypothetical protein